ncbi:thiol reductant ABC exporter subunit CydC [Radiobacillus sp. PE A8.2]|uniref:thiol reductant ABC exporter subunit CydC n=1 Tax=Radiobacillus sp. PE A8.2 TaxID=3380349 RepID=UPI003890FCBD
MRQLTVIMKLMLREKKDVVYSILFGFVGGIASVGLFAASGYLVAKAALATPIYMLIILTSTVKLLGFVKAISRYAERLYSHRATFTMLSNVRVAFFEKLNPVVPGIFQKYRSGDLLARIVGDVESLQNFFLRVVYPPIVLILVFLATILFTAYYSIYIALLLLLGLVLTTFVIPALFSLRQAKLNSKVREKRGHLSTDITEFFYGYQDLKIYQKLEQKSERLLQTSDDYIHEQERENRNILYSQSWNSFVSFFVAWLVLAVSAFLVTSGQLDGLYLAMLLMIALTVFESAAPMAVFPTYMEETKLATKRLFSVVGEEDITTAPAESFVPLEPGAHHIRIQDVSFSYPGDERRTIDTIAAQFPRGSKTAIVGPSGSGKSTLLQLILNIYKPIHGEIYIDDLPLEEIEQKSLWEEAKVVLQGSHFFYGTIRDNLLLADSKLEDQQMEAMLANVQLSHFSLDDTVYENAENLSGGEKQRLAIARAMLKQGRLWVLDEPTSSVDAVTESIIYKRLFQQAKADTLILVSHRLAGLENMDQIIAMDQGKVIESGSFDELMQKKGYFYEMWQLEKSLL